MLFLLMNFSKLKKMNLNPFFHNLSTFKIDFLFVLISQRYTYLPKRMNFFGYINFKEFVWNPLILSNEWLNKEKTRYPSK